MPRTHVLLATALTVTAAATAGPANASPFRLGEPVPALTLPSVVDGSRLSLADFRGRRVMLHVWASW